ncbi:DEAD/DEAH box helicase, partial [Candidatus Gracilibacteria bacterium]|nr:DEAD/DEAH box helicase [Candidatus Gracilibacteria bacterium]
NIQKNIVLDTFFLANFLSLNCKSLSLEYLAGFYNIDLTGAHRALNDTKATISLFQALFKEFDKLDENKKRLISFFFFNSNDANIKYLKNLLFKDVYDMKFEDFVILQLDKIKKNNFKKIFSPIKDELINQEIESYFDKIPDFEQRESQIKMALNIYDNLNNGKKTVIEAPTGIGKTLAYLIPAIIYSVKNSKKIFISTKTKILQDQMYYKDMDIVEKHLGIDFNYTKIKGKKNYISLYSFFDFVKETDFDYEKVSFLSKISLWLYDTVFGELDELFYPNYEYKFLKFVNSDNMSTLGEKNPYLKKEFVYNQKINLEIANIVIVNHSLLFSDLKNDFNFFGKIENLIIDEAHSIEDIATESLKNTFSIKQLEDILGYTENIYKYNFIDATNLRSIGQEILSNITLFLDIFNAFLKQKTNNENFYINALLDGTFYQNQTEYFYKLGSTFKSSLLDLKVELLSVKYDFSREINNIDKIVDIVDKIVDNNNHEEYIKIASYNDYEGIKIEYTILDIGKYLRINFWDYLDNCFLFSATLTIAGKFDYIKKTLSLDGFDFQIYETDFDYKNQAKVFIPKDIGSIKNNFSTVLDFLKDMFSILKGNTLVLFTSISAVRNVYVSLNFFVQSLGSKLLAQSIYGSKNKVLDTFLQSHNNSIILGTDSFWEGIDIPGEPLKYLIIHKIPFLVPTDPIFLSRSKLYSNPFSEYSVPKSIIKLKQGFGRLIRTKKDTGVVIFLDDRIFSTEWGKVFINAFPTEIDINLISKNDIIDRLSKM